MKFYLTIEDENDGVVYETVAPTWEILEERIGQLQRANNKYLSHD